ncbi:MAG: hypothetical protein Q7S18_00015 [bacterium]|nr:hypothetical protein [bacterium]
MEKNRSEMPLDDQNYKPQGKTINLGKTAGGEKIELVIDDAQEQSYNNYIETKYGSQREGIKFSPDQENSAQYFQRIVEMYKEKHQKIYLECFIQANVIAAKMIDALQVYSSGSIPSATLQKYCPDELNNALLGVNLSQKDIKVRLANTIVNDFLVKSIEAVQELKNHLQTVLKQARKSFEDVISGKEKIKGLPLKVKISLLKNQIILKALVKKNSQQEILKQEIEEMVTEEFLGLSISNVIHDIDRIREQLREGMHPSKMSAQSIALGFFVDDLDICPEINTQIFEAAFCDLESNKNLRKGSGENNDREISS